MENLFSLSGRVALITGAGRGIGRQIARTFADAGAAIAIGELDVAAGEDAAAEIRKLGCEAIVIKVDVSDSASVNTMAQQVNDKFGKIDVLVANAGICINVAAEAMTDDQWLKVININLNGVFFSCRAVAKFMLARGSGSIINIGSMSGLIVNKPQPQSGYNASKAGVIHLTRSLAAEWAPRGVRVNSISPGYTATDITQRSLTDDPARGKVWMDMTPMNRMGTTKEVALAALYLASDASSYTTGSDLVVDGGYTAW